MAGLFLLALWLRLTGIDGPSLKLWDDFITLAIADQPNMGAVIRQLLGQQQPFVDFQPPLYYLLIQKVLELGRSDVAVRFPGVIAGALAVPALFAFARNLFGRPAAFYGAVVLAILLYPIEYSQQVRPYALFLTLTLLSMGAFHRLAEGPSPGDAGRPAKPGVGNAWRVGWYVLVSFAMCMTSYLGLINIACQGTYLCVRLATCGKDGGPRRAWPLPVLGLVLVAAAYVPWYMRSAGIQTLLAGHFEPKPSELWRLLGQAMGEFFSTYNEYLSFPSAAIPFLALCAAGLVGAVVRRRKTALLYLLCWAGISLGLLAFRESQAHHLRVRYLVSLFACLVMLAGMGLDFLTARMGRRRAWAGYAAGLVLLGIVNLPNWPAYGFFYRRETNAIKDLALAVTEMDIQADSLAVVPGNGMWTPSMTSRALNWYLPGVFAPLADVSGARYRRVLLLAPEMTDFPPERLGQPRAAGGFRAMRFAVTGLVNRSPLHLYPDAEGTSRCQIDPGALDVFGQCLRADNVGLDDPGLGVVRKEAPGEVVFCFVSPADNPLAGARLDMEAIFSPAVNGLADSVAVISARAGGDTFREIGRLAVDGHKPSGESASSPRDSARKLKAQCDVPEEVLRRGDLEIRVVLDNRADYGKLLLTRLSFEGRHARGQSAVENAQQAARQAGALLARLDAHPWKGGEAPMCWPNLVAFGPGDAAARKAYLSRFPQARPVLRLPEGVQPGASALTEVYDPGLDSPSLALVAGQPQLLTYPRKNGSGLVGLRLPATDLGEIGLGGQTLALNMSAPLGTKLTLLSRQPARLTHIPLYDAEPVISADTEMSGQLYKKQGEPCLSCRDAKPCSIEYAYSSGLPLTSLRLEYYPRVYADVRFSNRIAVSCSLDGGPFFPLASTRGMGSLTWEGLTLPRVVQTTFPAPAKSIRVRFTLSGDGAQLWSSRDYPMRLDAWGDTLLANVSPAMLTLESSQAIKGVVPVCREPVGPWKLWRHN